MIRFNKEIMGTRESDHYATPVQFMKILNDEFKFDFDPCPLRCDKFNGLEIPWLGNIYCNPPYSNIKPFIVKGIKEINKKNAKKVVFLIPARTDVKYWHDLILKYATEIRFVKGRLHFNESEKPAPFPVVIIVFDKWLGKNGLSVKSYFQKK